VEGYCSSYSSSPLLKPAFQLETKAESSKIIIMPVMTICIDNWEKENDCHESYAAKAH